MKFDIIESDWSNEQKSITIISFILIIIQNIAQMIKTYQVKSAKEFSEYYLLTRILGCYLLIFYSIQIDSLYVLIINVLPIISTTFIGYYKIKEIKEKCSKKYTNVINLEFLVSPLSQGKPPSYDIE
jgi:uncharacterized protein with PQ loop repeat